MFCNRSARPLLSILIIFSLLVGNIEPVLPVLMTYADEAENQVSVEAPVEVPVEAPVIIPEPVVAEPVEAPVEVPAIESEPMPEIVESSVEIPVETLVEPIITPVITESTVNTEIPIEDIIEEGSVETLIDTQVENHIEEPEVITESIEDAEKSPEENVIIIPDEDLAIEASDIFSVEDSNDPVGEKSVENSNNNEKIEENNQPEENDEPGSIPAPSLDQTPLTPDNLQSYSEPTVTVEPAKKEEIYSPAPLLVPPAPSPSGGGGGAIDNPQIEEEKDELNLEPNVKVEIEIVPEPENIQFKLKEEEIDISKKEQIIDKLEKIDQQQEDNQEIEKLVEKYEKEQEKILKIASKDEELTRIEEWTLKRELKKQKQSLEKINNALEEELKDQLEEELTTEEKELIEYIEPNYMMGIQAIAVNDPDYSRQWALPKIQAPEVWETSVGDPSVVIAVLDTGLDFNHSDKPMHIAAGYDFINNDSNPQDDHGHGTFISGLIAAQSNNANGIAGLCWNCTVMPIKVISGNGLGTYQDVVNGIHYAVDQGADIINMSLGGYEYSQSLLEAINYAHQKGVTVVAAGGNQGIDNLIYPAAYPNVIGVSATDENDERWTNSNFGEYIDVSAPGVGVYGLALNNGYQSQTGTSVAAAHIAGIAGLFLAQNSNLTNNRLVQKIYDNTIDLGDAGRDLYYGVGRVDIGEGDESNNVNDEDENIELPISPGSDDTNNKKKICNKNKIDNDSSGNESIFPPSHIDNGKDEINCNDDYKKDDCINDCYFSHNLKITDIKIEPLAFQSGETVNIIAYVENQGKFKEKDITAEVFVNGDLINPNQTIDDIAPQEIQMIYFNWTPSFDSGQQVQFQIRAKISNIKDEEKINDNVLIINPLVSSENGIITIQYSGDVHKYLTKQAVEYLQHINQDAYIEASSYLNNLEQGAFNEDRLGGLFEDEIDVSWRPLRHFYRPTDKMGYFDGGTFNTSTNGGMIRGYPNVPDNTRYPNAYEWAINEKYDGTKLENSHSFQDAIDAYNQGNKSEAYQALGHVIHLVEDMSVPEHTQLESHADVAFAFDGELGSGYEQFITYLYNNNDTRLSQYVNQADNLDYYDQIIKNFETLEEYFDSMAILSYYKNRFQGNLSKEKGQIGELEEMFPSLEYNTESNMWEINRVGPWADDENVTLNDTWWETAKFDGNSDSSNWYYIENSFKQGDEWAVRPAKYKTDWYSYALAEMKKSREQRFKTPYSGEYVTNDQQDGKILAEVFAEDLVPLSVQHAAGVLDLFWRETHPESFQHPDLKFEIDDSFKFFEKNEDNYEYYIKVKIKNEGTTPATAGQVCFEPNALLSSCEGNTEIGYLDINETKEIILTFNKTSSLADNETIGTLKIKEDTVIPEENNQENSIQTIYKNQLQQWNSTFFDVSPNDWSRRYIDYVFNNNVVQGYGDGTYGPADSVTRSQVLKMAYEGAGKVTNANAPNPEFKDVDGDEWYYEYVADAKEKGYIKGKSCDDDSGQMCFYPSEPVNRYEAAKIVYAVFQNIDYNTSGRTGACDDFTRIFPDVDQDDWFCESVRWLARSKALWNDNGMIKKTWTVSGYKVDIGGGQIINYYGGQQIDSNNNLTNIQSINRAEMAKITANTMVYKSTGNGNVLPLSVGILSEQSNNVTILADSDTIVTLGKEYEQVLDVSNTNAPDPVHLPNGDQQTITESDVLEMNMDTEDADGDKLFYFWNATGGSFTATDTVNYSSATWHPPQITEDTIFYITVIRGDNRGYISEGRFEITVQNTISDAEVDPTIHSTIAGGDWDDPNTWVEGRVPTEDDQVEINGEVELSSNIKVSDLLINTEGLIKGWQILTVNSDIINNGTIKNSTIEASGNITNNGTWNSSNAYLIGTAPRFIDCTTPISANIEFKNSIKIIGNPIFAKKVTIYDKTLTLNSGSTMTLLGTLYLNGEIRGNGKVIFDGARQDIDGGFYDDKAATIYASEVIFQGNGKKYIDKTTVINGDLIIKEGAEIQGSRSLKVNGDIINNGEIEGSFLSISISGNITNSGKWENYMTNLIGANSRFINGITPIKSRIVLHDNIQITNSPTIDGEIALNGKTITLQEKDTLTLLGDVSIEGQIKGADKVIFAGKDQHIYSMHQPGSISANKIIFQGDGQKKLGIEVINGDIEINKDASVWFYDDTITLINGNVQNDGTIFGNVNISGDIINNEKWSVYKTNIIWPTTENASEYELLITDVNRNWQNIVSYSASYSIVNLLNTSHKWKVRAVVNDTPQEWSDIHYINPQPEIEIFVDETQIEKDSGYDFGSHNVDAQTETIFTIKNTGGQELSLTDNPAITLSGTNVEDPEHAEEADQFSVITQPQSPLATNTSTTFTIKFTPTSADTKNATISIANNDEVKNPYTINLSGKGIAVAGGGGSGGDGGNVNGEEDDDNEGDEEDDDIPESDTTAPTLTITAPTKNSNTTITDTTIRITDTGGIMAANVVIDASNTATVDNFSCSQTSTTEVNCSLEIKSNGDLAIKATDNAGNINQATEKDYMIISVNTEKDIKDEIEIIENKVSTGGGSSVSVSAITPPSTSNSATSIQPSNISKAIKGDATFSRPIQLKGIVTKKNKSNKEVKSARLTDKKGTMIIKPNKASTASAIIPPNTTVYSDNKWNGKIQPPLIYSTSIVKKKGETIINTNQKLTRDIVDVVIKAGSHKSTLTFSNPIDLNIPVDLPNGTKVAVLWSSDSNTWEKFGHTTVNNGIASIQTTHFSYYAISSKIDFAEKRKINTITKNYKKNNIKPRSVVASERTTPYNTITRAELTKMVVDAFNIPISSNIRDTSFYDVDTKAWYASYIEAAYKAGWAKGYTTLTNLRPIRRVLLSNYQGDDVSVLQTALRHHGFYRGPVTGFYDNRTKFAVFRYQRSLGWKGSGNIGWHTLPRINRLIANMPVLEIQNFHPNQPIRRAEALKIILEALNTKLNGIVKISANEADQSLWHMQYINFIKNNNISISTGRLDQNLTHTEAARIMIKILDFLASNQHLT